MSVRWIIVKPRGGFNNAGEINTFSLKEVSYSSKIDFIGSVYCLGLNINVITNRPSKAYYALLVKRPETTWFSVLILGKDIPLDTRIFNIISQYYPEYNLNSNLNIETGNVPCLMMIDEYDIMHFKQDIYDNIESQPRIMFEMMMNDYSLGLRHQTIETSVDIMTNFLAPLFNPLGGDGDQYRETRRVIKNDDLVNLPRFNYSEFIKYCEEHNNKPNKECYITLEDFKEGDEIIVLPCYHAYTSDKIEKWLKTNCNKCPVCKSDVGTGILMYI